MDHVYGADQLLALVEMGALIRLGEFNGAGGSAKGMVLPKEASLASADHGLRASARCHQAWAAARRQAQRRQFGSVLAAWMNESVMAVPLS